jgi:hypothetical protein
MPKVDDSMPPKTFPGGAPPERLTFQRPVLRQLQRLLSMRSITRGQLAPRHISAVRSQLVAALAMGWVLGGCFDESPRDETWRRYVAQPEPEPEQPRGLCAFGDAGVQCHDVDTLDELVDSGSFPEATHTEEGCVDAKTALYAGSLVSCGPYPAGTGKRQGDQCCYSMCFASPGCGRPFVIDGAARVAEPRQSPEWAGLDASANADEANASVAIAGEWLRDALAEHASVAAFSAFNLSLLALGAPAELLRASAAATLDEVAHARACFELASHYAGRSLSPGVLDIGGFQVAADLATAVERAFLDGCVGETAAALVARASLEVCDSPRVRAVLERIAEDETRHAELAWQFIAWALRQGGTPVARVLQLALERAEAGRGAGACRASVAAPPEWHRAGRLSEAEREHISERALQDIARPLLQALLARHLPDREVLLDAARGA